MFHDLSIHGMHCSSACFSTGILPGWLGLIAACMKLEAALYTSCMSPCSPDICQILCTYQLRLPGDMHSCRYAQRELFGHQHE